MDTTFQWRNIGAMEYSSQAYGGEHEFFNANLRDIRDGCVKLVQNHVKSHGMDVESVETWEAVFEAREFKVVLQPSGFAHAPDSIVLSHVVVKMNDGSSFNIEIGKGVEEFAKECRLQAFYDRKIQDALRSGAARIVEHLVAKEKVVQDEAEAFAYRYVRELNGDDGGILKVDLWDMAEKIGGAYRRYRFMEATGGDTSRVFI